MNYDDSDYRCVTSPANATNVRVRECRQGAAETCVTKTVYTKGICKTVYTKGRVYWKTENKKGSVY